MSQDDSINWDKVIEYCSFPDHIAFCYGDKIYINPIVKKYPSYHKHVLEHEKTHYKNRGKQRLIRFISNFFLEWQECFFIHFISKSQFKQEFHNCNLEFKKIFFSSEDRKQFRNRFPITSEDRLYIYLRPDNWPMIGTIAFLLISIPLKILGFLLSIYDLPLYFYLFMFFFSLLITKFAFLVFPH